MANEDILKSLAEAVIEGEEDLVADLTDQAISMGLEPLEIINDGLTRGIEIVGANFSA